MVKQYEQKRCGASNPACHRLELSTTQPLSDGWPFLTPIYKVDPWVHSILTNSGDNCTGKASLLGLDGDAIVFSLISLTPSLPGQKLGSIWVNHTIAH